MEKPITPVILTGGSGTRLWPVSRDTYPKQFLPLFGNRSTYQQTLERVAGKEFMQPVVMTSADFRFFVRDQAREVGVEPEIVLEPMRRDSGPAVVAAALRAFERDNEALLLILAADHIVSETELFRDTCMQAARAAQEGYITTFGIRPTEPKTSYGYINPGRELGPGVRAVSRFVEKPDRETASRYIKEGYLWNSGNFLFKAKVFLEEVKRYEPAMLEAVSEASRRAEIDLGFVRLAGEAFARAPQKSVDYAVMERTALAAVAESAFRWSDIGSWEGIYQSVERDPQGNAVRGSALMVDTEGSLVHAERMTALLGVKNLIVITTPDAVLVASRDRAEEVKKLVDVAGKAGIKRPGNTGGYTGHGGYFESVDAGNRFQVKRIVVSPGGVLSLQRHVHRSEHWVVVQGVAEVTLNEEKRLLNENESLYVPIGTVHRLKNPGKIPLELIEVQTGSYLGEDDITRFDDIYNRTN